MTRRLFLLPLLALAACDRGGDDGNEAAPAAAALPPIPAQANLIANAADATGSTEGRVEAAMAAILPDPASATYANVREGRRSAICGEVTSASPVGGDPGKRDFVVLPEGVAVTSLSAGGAFENPADVFADLYVQYCATPAEAARIASLRRQLTAAGAIELPEAEPLPPVPEDPGASPPPPRAAPPAPVKSVRGGEGEGFFDRVLRPAEKGE